MRHLAIGLFALIGLVVWSDDASAASKGELPNQAVLILKDSSKRDEAIKRLPKKFQIVVSQGSVVILRAKQISDAEIAELGRLENVDKAYRDSVVTAKGVSKKKAKDVPVEAACPTPVDSTGVRAAADQAFDGEVLNLQRCPKQTCEGVSMRWGQERVDADLAQAELKGMNLAPTQVGLLDSGFDKSMQSEMGHPVQFHKGIDDATPGDVDKDSGHGTGVASLIGGKDVGVAPNSQIHFYGITTDFDRTMKSVYPGAVGSRGSRMAALERACADGNEIVNISMGDSLDEHGEDSQRDEVLNKAIIDKCAENGVLVVKAAGNDGAKKKHASDNPDDAYLRVAAVGPAGDEPEFSSTGELAAPGEKVEMLGLPGSAMVNNAKGCRSMDVKSAAGRVTSSGTSFAAPITAGAASNVLQILKTSDEFKAIKGRDRIRVLNRILQASSRDGSINAYRAVMIAKNWLKNPNPQISVAHLKRDYEISAASLCAVPVPECSKKSSCEERGSCVAEVRKQWSSCPKRTDRQLFELASLAADQGDFAQAMYLIKQHGGKFPQNAELAELKKTLVRESIRRFTNSEGGKDSPVEFWGDAFTMKRTLGQLPYWAVKEFSNAAEVVTFVYDIARVEGLAGLSELPAAEQKERVDYFIGLLKAAKERAIELVGSEKAEPGFKMDVLDHLVEIYGKHAGVGVKDQKVVLSAMVADPFFQEVKAGLQGRINELDAVVGK